MNLIERNLPQLVELCGRFRVARLSVFGSVLTNRFNAESDVDLLVDFDTTDHEEWDYVGNYFGFQEALESLFNRKVDLITEKSLKNKFLINNINRTKKIIYG